MNRRLTNVFGVLAFSSGLSAVLWAAEVSSTITPRHFTLHELANQVDSQGPAAGAMSVLRMVTLAASTYVAALMLLTVVARVSRRGNLERLLAPLTPRVLRPAIGALVVSATLAAQPAYAEPPNARSSGAGPVSTAPVLIRVDESADNTPTTTGPTMRWIGPAPASAEPSVTTPASAQPSVTTPPSAQPSVRVWTVERGDHLWHIAEATLVGHLDRLPSPRETRAYWLELMAANRDRLVDPDNPNLIYPGQEFLLPDP